MQDLAATTAAGAAGLDPCHLLLPFVISTQGQQQPCTATDTRSSCHSVIAGRGEMLLYVLLSLSVTWRDCKLQCGAHQSAMLTCCCRLVCGQCCAAVKCVQA
jgi:hypothetical protein